MSESMIVSDPKVLMGKPVVMGTRVSVDLILEKLGSDKSIEAVLESHPGLTREGVLAALRFAAQAVRAEVVFKGGSIIAASVIGPFLVIYAIVLSCLALVVWLAEGWAPVLSFLGMKDLALTQVPALSQTKFGTFQQIVLAACSAGLGGIVFMIREFYLNFAYDTRPESKRKPTDRPPFLQAYEIPRYVLLPFSSVVLGPVGLALLQAGAVAFVGFSREVPVPLYSIIAVSFLLGFGYHDTLGALRRLSRKLFKAGEREEDGKP